MIHRTPLIAAAAISLLSALPARAEVKAVHERNEAAAASGAFKFKTVPQPSRSDAAQRAKVSVVDGTRDRNGGDAAVLTDGRVPGTGDQPRDNFFFAPETDGGRIALDLGEAVDVKQVNTYSWHRDTRGPQVYKLYASDGSSADFAATPKRGTDPSAAGWTLVAAVDTRPKDGAPGGQYGVTVADSTGAPVGRYRYLLLDVSRTEGDDAFGNTFLSEIDVVDANGPAAAEPAVASTFGPGGQRGGGGRNLLDEPAGPRDTITTTAEGGYEIVFDVTETPDLKEWVDTKLKPVCAEWYPKIVAMLPSEGYEAPKKFTVTFRSGLRVPAMAGGNRVSCSAEWMRRNLDGEAAGAVVHELVHVVQQYGRRRNEGGGAAAAADAPPRPRVRNPGWLVEGLADYIRWFLYEDQSQRPRPNAQRANYNDSYRTTGHFLNYLTEKYDKDIVKKLNAAMRDGKYNDELWKEITGKTAEDLGEEWKKTL